MTLFPQVRAVLFDLDDTLCDDLAATERTLQHLAARAAAHLPGLSAGDLISAYTRLSDELWRDLDLVRPPSLRDVRRRLWENALADCGRNTCDPAVVNELADLHVQLRHSGVRLFPDALSTLDRLRAAGLRLGLVTNGVSETHAEKIVGLGIRDLFDVLLMPDQAGFAKPDARVFHTACTHLNVAPHQTAMVGDSVPADIAGAKHAGLIAVWYNPRGAPFPAATPRPDAELRTLTDLPALVTRVAETPSSSTTPQGQRI